MDLTELKSEIINKFKGNKKELYQILKLIDNDIAIYPFNEYELMICTMLYKRHITYDDYLSVRRNYITKNPYLYLFEISGPRSFGEKYTYSFLKPLCQDILIPDRRIDPHYANEYDYCLRHNNDLIKIEVKASRVVENTKDDEPLYKKALSTTSNKPFLMNFQQLKPQCCDIFIWMAFYRDDYIIWVMNSYEVKNHKDYSQGQHRGNKGKEGQLHITNKNITSLNRYKLKDKTKLKSAIILSFERLKKYKNS